MLWIHTFLWVYLLSWSTKGWNLALCKHSQFSWNLFTRCLRYKNEWFNFPRDSTSLFSVLCFLFSFIVVKFLCYCGRARSARPHLLQRPSPWLDPSKQTASVRFVGTNKSRFWHLHIQECKWPYKKKWKFQTF